MKKRQVIIVGGGIAGAATAWALAEAGMTDVLLLERAGTPGVHSTGRNAAILRTAIPDPTLQALALESAEFYRAPPAGFAPQALVDQVGLFLATTTATDADALLPWVGHGLEVDWAELRAHHPYLQHQNGRVWHFPQEGVLDVHAILHGFLHHAQSAGVEIRYRTEVTDLLLDDAQILGVNTTHGPLDAENVVLAEGGWAGRLAQQHGSSAPSFQARRRHLMVSGVDHAINPQAPVVWNLGADEFYFRPESGGLLMSACDHVAVSAEDGEVLDRDVLSYVAEKALRWLPGLENLNAAHAWAGMRTFPESNGFHIGPDANLQGLHWVAGLGGHGMTCAPAVGRLAARLLLGSRKDLGQSIEI